MRIPVDPFLNYPTMTVTTTLLFLITLSLCDSHAFSQGRQTINFNSSWQFHPGDLRGAERKDFNDKAWRTLDLPHDWSIEFPFDKESPTGTGGGALRGGMGWYRKKFLISPKDAGKSITITFDGVYRNSEVWVNGHYLGKRANGYISFQYDLTSFVIPGDEPNIIAVRVDNSEQPNSRWYSGSGIYRNVWLTFTGRVHTAHLGSYITTPAVTAQEAQVNQEIVVENRDQSPRKITIITSIENAAGIVVARNSTPGVLTAGEQKKILQTFSITNPSRWSIDSPYLYQAITTIEENEKVLDQYTTTFGIRSFVFDPVRGFLLNGSHVKIRGVCMHHDLGCLGTAVNTSAIRRQLRILKEMGCNGIRTSHNPPSPELLDCCDEMGFIVMDEAFDIWKQSKTKFDYHLDWELWHRRDLEDQVRRDRNHPSVFIWSLGNEIPEQWMKEGDSTGVATLRELNDIVKDLDNSRLTVTANNEIGKGNQLLRSGIADMIGYNYNHRQWDSAQNRWGQKPFIVTESVSALQTRGHYDLPADSIRRWPVRWDLPFATGNADLTCSAYDNCSTPWGSTHEETLREFDRSDRVSGMFIWTGFDYIGEPTPYGWPARSSYFGIVDLAGFPKDVYYMYQSVWTNKPVLHLLPHWNWTEGQSVDVWAYYNEAEEVELYLDGQSLGKRVRKPGEFHVSWRVPFHAGILKAISRRDGRIVLQKEIRTTGKPARIILEADHSTIDYKNDELAFISVKVVDKEGTLVPGADDLVSFVVDGGRIVGTDNGNQTDLESFQSTSRKAFHGRCLAVVESFLRKGEMTVRATGEGLQGAVIQIRMQ
jgi:beta-galactosidase